MIASDGLNAALARPLAGGLSLNLTGLTLFLRRRWKWIVGTAAAIAVLAALALLQMTRLYTAQASVAVQTQKTQVVDIQDVVSGLSPDAATMETQVSILRAPRLARMVADQLKLDSDPEFAPSPRLQGAERSAAVIDRLEKAYDIQPVERSYVISINATSRDPEKAARLANALADAYIADGLATKYEATRRAAAYLQKRVGELKQQAVSADQVAQSYRSQAGLMGSETQGTVSAQQLSELSTQLVTARADRAAKEAQLAQIQRLAAAGDPSAIGTSSAVLNSPLIQRLREQESQALRELAELQATFGDRHPKVINAQAELRDLRSKIQEEVGKLATAAANDVAIARARESALAGSVSGAEGAVSAGGLAEVKLRELQRESDANKSVYEVFLNRLKETNQQVDLQTADQRIVSLATVPLSPSSPRIRPVMAVAVLLGLVAGLAIAITLDRLDNTVRRGSELEALGAGAPLAHIPRLRASSLAKPENVFVEEETEQTVPEAVRMLRSALNLSDVDNPPRMVMLSSSVPGEGKTFTSCGLARVSAQSGARTLLIDADMRHPRVYKALDIANSPGLVQVLGGEAGLEAAIVADPKSALHVLPAGHGGRNPPDLLSSDQMAKLLTRLRGEYDFIVVDAPPFVPMTDSQILARLVDKMLLVVRWGHTPVPVVQTTIRQIHRLGVPLAGAVLSRIDMKRQAQYGYGDYGYHYTRYGSYFGAAR